MPPRQAFMTGEDEVLPMPMMCSPCDSPRLERDEDI